MLKKFQVSTVSKIREKILETRSHTGVLKNKIYKILNSGSIIISKLI